MKLTCPELSCQNQSSLQKDGHYFRKNDSKYIQRYRCPHCGRRFSTAHLSACFGQKKRTINSMVEKLYSSKVSIRRIAKVLRVDKKTIARKIVFLGIQAKRFNLDYIQKNFYGRVKHMQFDDLITKERTKMLPLSVSLAVDADTRRILGFRVSKIPAFGLLAKKSRKKYGKRKSGHRENLDKLFDEIKDCMIPGCLIRSDEHETYPKLVEKYFPAAKFNRFKSSRATIAGQGELKKISNDPLYSINHTFAMLRDNMSRLVRRSWCVTQKIEMLEHHLNIYMKYHNTELIKKAL